VTWGLDKDGGATSVWLLNPNALNVSFTRTISSEQAFDVVATGTGPVFSNSTCPQQLAASRCHSSNIGRLGDQISRLNLESGVETDSVSVKGVDFLVGPKPAAITVTGGRYHLVRVT
jgi:hypothetical protein